MSMFDNLGRFGVTIRQAHARSKAIRALNDLPVHVQKDIGRQAASAIGDNKLRAALLPGRR
ncbi:MAG: hypothetical protein EOQ38_08855 [Mesorhizobium sp.]|nr:MAG: hypothetical protein EOQ38_08855 [Mesorhizobium sp.]